MNTVNENMESLRSEENGDDAELKEVNRIRKDAERLIVFDDGPNANLFDTARFEQCYRIAKAMSQMSILPDHLRMSGSKSKGFKLLTEQQITANCFRIVNQAVRWGMDPYAIVDETYVVGGKLGYQGKLVAAVVNSRAGLAGRLEYSFAGSGDDLTVTVSGLFDGEDKPKTVPLRLGDAKTSNEMWRKDPEQKLVYSGATKWARRHCPEVVLGVMTEDDLERISESDARDNPRALSELKAVPMTAPTTSAEEQPAAKESIASKSANAADDLDDPHWIAFVKGIGAGLAECESMTDVSEYRDLSLEIHSQSDAECEDINEACDARIVDIRAARGGSQ